MPYPIINGKLSRRGKQREGQIRCPIDGKVIYETEEEAEKVVMKVKGIHCDGWGTMNAYLCVQTGTYHIGHKNRGCG